MAAKKTAKKKAAKKVATGVCAAGYEMIRRGWTNQRVLEEIRKKFPESRLDIGGVGWLRNKLRRDGEKIKMNRELTQATAKPVKAKAKKPASKKAA